MNTRATFLTSSVLILLVAIPATVHAFAAQGRGGGAAPAPSSRDAEDDDLGTFYFRTADWDADGSIRFSEAEQSMGLDLDEFGVYDKDRDGLISESEYSARYRVIVQRGGVFSAPRAKPDAARPTKRDGKALLTAYDSDVDGMLGESELAHAMQEARVEEPTPQVMLATLDKDKSFGVDGAELDELSKFLFPEKGAPSAKKAASIAELFDHPLPKETRSGATMGPQRTVGPISVYRRLDYDRSGGIELNDLEELQRPLRSVVRPAAVFATLDTDGNGSISPEEFAAAME